MVSLLSLTYSVLLLAARLTCKWEYLSYDDAVLGLGYVFAAVHYGIILQAISGGLGALATIPSLPQIATVAEVRWTARWRNIFVTRLYSSQHYFTSRILGLITLCLSKVSVLLFTRSIFSATFAGGAKKYFAAAHALVAVYGIASILLSSAGCDPHKVLVDRPSAVCSGNASL